MSSHQWDLPFFTDSDKARYDYTRRRYEPPARPDAARLALYESPLLRRPDPAPVPESQ
jgi:hypothetical protein